VPRTPAREARFEALSRHYNGFLFPTRTNKHISARHDGVSGFTKLTIRG
jgi:hypothetical protein